MQGTTILCITIRLVYDTLCAFLGSDGFLFRYADDVYMGGASVQVAVALFEAPGVYALVGLKLGWVRRRQSLYSPLTVIQKIFPYRETHMAISSRTFCPASRHVLASPSVPPTMTR